MSPTKADRTIDVRGQSCPYPLVTTSKNISTVPVGCVLEVLATDPAAIQNITRWAQRGGHQMLEVVTEDDGHFRIFVRRGI